MRKMFIEQIQGHSPILEKIGIISIDLKEETDVRVSKEVTRGGIKAMRTYIFIDAR